MHRLTHDDRRFGCVIPVGPNETDCAGLRDLLESLWHYEPVPSVCVLVDNASQPRRLDAGVRPPPSCEIVSLFNPHHDLGEPMYGAICCDVLAGLRMLRRYAPLSFVLRLDTDALVIRPFVDRLLDYLSGKPKAGVVGTVGRTCRRDERDYGFERDHAPRLVNVARRISRLPVGCVTPDGWTITSQVHDDFAVVRSHVEDAVAHGYSWMEYAQGGAFAITAELLRRMDRSGYLERPDAWTWVPIGDDVMMGMYARATALDVVDYSNSAELFGSRFRGLAYPPADLLARGYSLIHSVKSDTRFPEQAVRSFFRERRQTA